MLKTPLGAFTFEPLLLSLYDFPFSYLPFDFGFFHLCHCLSIFFNFMLLYFLWSKNEARRLTVSHFCSYLINSIVIFCQLPKKFSLMKGLKLIVFEPCVSIFSYMIFVQKSGGLLIKYLMKINLVLRYFCLSFFKILISHELFKRLEFSFDYLDHSFLGVSVKRILQSLLVISINRNSHVLKMARISKLQWGFALLRMEVPRCEVWVRVLIIDTVLRTEKT